LDPIHKAYLSPVVIGGELLAAKQYEQELLMDFKEMAPGPARDEQIEAVAQVRYVVEFVSGLLW
jgi:hypothetical protein